jgi:nicotinamidase-related amidase
VVHACLELTALSALAEGYEVFILVDACGSPNVESHQTAVPGW